MVVVKQITCVSGEVTLCDDQDYPLLSRFTWYMGSNLKVGGYPCCFIYKKNREYTRIFMHQLVGGGAITIDHIDQNKLNNQSANLRAATHQINGWNKGKPKRCKHGKTTSQYKGVSYRPLKNKPRWLAYIKHVEEGKSKETGKVIYIGYFDKEIDAAKAYNDKVKELRGAYAWLNPLPEVG